jgi:hypothetical protein
MAWSLALRRTKINSFDPPLPAVSTAYPAPPLSPFFHPPIQLTSFRPRRYLDLNRRVNYTAICCGKLLQVGIAPEPARSASYTATIFVHEIIP